MDDDITEEERREAADTAYGAVEATERALEEIEGTKGELALAYRAVTAALVQLRGARAVLAGA